ncbi:MAG: hypothetical protein ACM3JH_11415, partial [Acidithiobacillales bacterium]
KNPDERFGSAAQMMLELVLARRELGSMSRTDKLIGMSGRVAAAETAARKGSGAGVSVPDAASGRARPTRSHPTARIPRARRPLSRAAIGALVAAALIVLAVLVVFLRART